MRDSWKEIRLVDLASFRRGSFPQPYGLDKWYDDNNGMPFIQVFDVDDNMKLKHETKRKISKVGSLMSVFIPKGTLILTIQGSIGRVAITDYDAYMDRTLLVFQKFYEEVDLKFIMYIIRELFNEAKENANGSTIKTITKEELSEYTINLPPLPQQRKIAHILTTCDAVIEKTEAAIAKYQAIKQGMMHDLFTRGILMEDITYTDKNGKVVELSRNQLRPKQEDAPELYKESELGWIPKEWEVNILDEVTAAVDPQPDHRTPAEEENGIPYLGINDIDDYGNINYKKCRKVSKTILEEHEKRYEIRNGDIIFGKIGTIGQPKILTNFSNLTLSANVILIQPQINPSYIYWFLNSEIVNQQVKNSVHTTSQPAFGMEKIRTLKIPLCKESEQKAFAERLDVIEVKMQKEQSTLSKYRQIKAGLMQDLLSGKVEVTVDGEEIAL